MLIYLRLLFELLLVVFVQRCKEGLWIVVPFLEMSYFCMLETLWLCITCFCATHSSVVHGHIQFITHSIKVLLEHVKTHSTWFTSNRTGIRWRSLSGEKISRSESMSIRQSHTDLLLLSLLLMVTRSITGVFAAISCALLGKWGRVTCRCWASPAFYPSLPVPLILLQMGLLLLLFSHPLSLFPSLEHSHLFNLSREQTSQSERGRDVGKKAFCW